MTRTCNHCGEQIFFKPHPRNPLKLVPFSSDGKIHFSVCKMSSKPTRKKLSTIKELPNCSKGHQMIWVFERMYPAAGRRLVGACQFLHERFLPKGDDIEALINCTTPQPLKWSNEERWDFIKTNSVKLDEWGMNFVASNKNKSWGEMTQRQQLVAVSLWDKVAGGPWIGMDKNYCFCGAPMAWQYIKDLVSIGNLEGHRVRLTWDDTRERFLYGSDAIDDGGASSVWPSKDSSFPLAQVATHICDKIRCKEF